MVIASATKQVIPHLLGNKKDNCKRDGTKGSYKQKHSLIGFETDLGLSSFTLDIYLFQLDCPHI